MTNRWVGPIIITPLFMAQCELGASEKFLVNGLLLVAHLEILAWGAWFIHFLDKFLAVTKWPSHNDGVWTFHSITTDWLIRIVNRWVSMDRLVKFFCIGRDHGLFVISSEVRELETHMTDSFALSNFCNRSFMFWTFALRRSLKCGLMHLSKCNSVDG